MPDDDILDINAEDLPAEDEAASPPKASSGDTAILEITWEDLQEEAAETEYLPPLTPEQLSAGQPGITIYTMCAVTGRAFAVRYVEEKPGLFVARSVDTHPEAWGLSSAQSPQGAAGLGAQGHVTGSFEISEDYACPFCGSRTIIVCGRCGVDFCAGSEKKGVHTCPQCHAQIGGISAPATSATGWLGPKKGKA